jgi:hypothetical protein
MTGEAASEHVRVDGDVVTIYGVRYSLALFSTLGFGPIGSRVELVARDDGVLTLRSLPSELTGYQVEHLADFVDREADAQISVARFDQDRTGSDGERMPAGLYAWFTEYPEEGQVWLPVDAPERERELAREATAAASAAQDEPRE